VKEICSRGNLPGHSIVIVAADAFVIKAPMQALIPEARLSCCRRTSTPELCTHQLRKVAGTLEKFGASVVDQNVGTPFYIYVENGSGFNIMGDEPAPKCIGRSI
jgi:hypothetical protein